jgi:hypothetical protein
MKHINQHKGNKRKFPLESVCISARQCSAKFLWFPSRKPRKNQIIYVINKQEQLTRECASEAKELSQHTDTVCIQSWCRYPLQ